MSTASETILALEKALEAGPTQEWRDCGGFTPGYGGLTSDDGHIVFDYADATVHQEHGRPIKAPSADKQFANRKFIAACSPLAIRTLLDAHASALRANAELLDQMHHFANADQRLWDEGQRDPESFKSWVRSRAAHLLVKFNKPAALDDNTKGAAE